MWVRQEWILFTSSCIHKIICFIGVTVDTNIIYIIHVPHNAINDNFETIYLQFSTELKIDLILYLKLCKFVQSAMKMILRTYSKTRSRTFCRFGKHFSRKKLHKVSTFFMLRILKDKFILSNNRKYWTT